MKVSHRLWSRYYGVLEFLKAHKLKLLLLLIVFIAACVMGIRAGCNVDAYTVLCGRTNFALLLSAGKRSVVGYIFTNLFFFAICWAAVMLLGLNFYLSFLGSLVYFYVVYTMGYAIAVYIGYFKLAALPYIIVCYIPYCFIMSFGIGCTIAVSLDCGGEMRRCGYFYIGVFKEHLPKGLIPLLIMLASVLYEGILGGLFTAGLII